MENKKERVHYIDDYIYNPSHPIFIKLIGCGGTGGQVLTALARIDCALKNLEHPGLDVEVYDDDIVTEANMGRQLFSMQDLDEYKSVVSVTRINRFFGLGWTAQTKRFIPDEDGKCNIIISCVDNVETRRQIDTYVKNPRKHSREFQRLLYWMDFGNDKSVGQVILGSTKEIAPRASKHEVITVLKTVMDIFPDMTDDVENDTPSCSLAEALEKQDLFINSALCQAGMALLWKVFRERRIFQHGVFMNLDKLKVNPVMV